MPNLKTTFAALAVAGMASAVLCSDAFAQSKGTVGIAMPTKSSARWIDDGNNMVKVLKDRGYTTDLQYAEDDIPNQLSQVENMVTKGAKVLVIAAITSAFTPLVIMFSTWASWLGMSSSAYCRSTL